MARRTRPGMRGLMRSGPTRQGGHRAMGALPPRVQQAVAAAVAQAANGQHEEAAASFHQLAERAHERGMAPAATRFQLNAAASTYAATNNPDALIQQVSIALDYAGALPNKRRAARRFVRLVQRLESDGQVEAAKTLEAQIVSGLGLDQLPKATDRPEVNRAQRRLLPKRCPSCGAAVKAEEVDWEDEGVSCSYCDNDLM